MRGRKFYKYRQLQKQLSFIHMGEMELKVKEKNVCDGKTIHNDSCKNSCTLSVCGDGNGEDYDSGNLMDNNSCQNICQAPPVWKQSY